MTDMDAPVDLLIGTYETGLHRLRYQPWAAPPEPQWSLQAALLFPANASYGAYHARHDLYYVVDEQPEGRIITCKHDDAGWRALSKITSGGAKPCFVETDPEGRFLAVANYDDGALTVFGLSPDTGEITAPVYSYTHSGHSLNPERQEGPHAHCARFHGEYLYSTDLGTDEILSHAFSSSAEEAKWALRLPAGQGPRHIIFHPHNGLGYILTELGSRVFVTDMTDPLRLEIIQDISTLPVTAESLGGHIALNAAGNRLHVSNRGHDSLTTFRVSDDGRLDLMANAPTHGASPRYFLLLEEYGLMVVAHEQGDTLTVLKINTDGSIGDCLHSIALKAPAFISRIRT